MATFHQETDGLVLHVVYDGAPLSGKTASVRALGRHLGREVSTPAEEQGRTLYFDWLEYEGGRKMGRDIHCRVVAVPGQRELRGRRRIILAAADVVVFVVDSTPAGVDAAEAHLVDLRRILSRGKRSVPIYLQINKRDLETALPLEEILSRLGGPAPAEGPKVHQKTVATDGAGVRETFVFAVGRALRQLEADGGLYRNAESERTTQEIFLPSSDRLLEMIQDLEREEPTAIDWDNRAVETVTSPADGAR